MIQERKTRSWAGIPVLIVLHLVILPAAGYFFIRGLKTGSVPMVLVAVAVGVGALIGLGGYFMVAPNQGQMLQLFGKYIGTVKIAGLQWTNPFYTARKVSLRVRNFETGKLKVNDQTGNPVEIAAVVVWQVVDTAEAIFHVDDFENFVHVQSEAALRNLATGFPYVSHKEGEIALSSHTAEISGQLKTEIQERLTEAGVKVLEARISHLAYSPEIAAAMLQRQQASAVVAARTKIVEGAVGMVQMALDELSKKQILELDEERKAAMVSNLLVVLCSDRHTQPVVNTGGLYS